MLKGARALVERVPKTAPSKPPFSATFSQVQ
jgi:hypothetical protein